MKSEPALHPADAKSFGRAPWLEEYADTKLAAWLDAVHANPWFKPIVEEEIAQFQAM